MSRNWLITGTSSGLGREMVELLLARGDHVAATLRKRGALDPLQMRYRERLWVAELDVTDSDAVRAVVDGAFNELGRIDVVVNNAGYGLFGAAEEVSDNQIRHQIDTNLIGSMQVIRAAIAHLRAQGGGRILQVSSEGGQIGYPCFSVYHATKWGIEGFIESVSQEVAPFGIEFTIAEPGPARTRFGVAKVDAPSMAVYNSTPVGDMRRALNSGTFVVKGDPVKMAKAMIDSVGQTPAPKRLALGSSTYHSIKTALTDRLATLDTFREVTLSTDTDD